MRVYLFNQQVLSVISRKEEITDETCLITDEEAEKIENSLRYDGYIWRIDKYTVGCSGGRPTADHKWNEELKQWELSQDLVNERLQKERADVWEKLKQCRTQATQTGIELTLPNGSIRHFHTDEVARREYDGVGVLIVLGSFKPRQWKTIENDYVELDLDLFRQLAVAISDKVQHDYLNAEKLKAIVDKSDEPLKVDLDQGWSKSYV